MRSGLMSSFRPSADPRHERPSLDDLYDSCRKRFRPPAYEIRKDEAGDTVWVSRAGVHFQVGIQPNTVARRGLVTTLERAEARLSEAQPVSAQAAE